MGLNETPSANRVHIGFFGRRNAGKSSLVNAVTGQDLAVVSDTKGTTTDPVYKAMELLPLGPVVIIDTPGFDDEGTLGQKRVDKAKQVLNKTDVAVLVVDATVGMQDCDNEILELFKEKEINFVVAMNKSDLLFGHEPPKENELYVSAHTMDNITELKERISILTTSDDMKLKLVADLISPMDFVVLVTPIDASAPKGRLILPQQQAIRDILEANAVSIVVRETELCNTLENVGKKPSLVITDSQAFARVNRDTPQDIPLTSFSILMARYKGLLKTTVAGVAAIERLYDGDTILIVEGCTHHRQCEDIGTVKIPNWLRNYTGHQLNIKTASGTEFPEDLSPYALVLHCGGCMLNEREVKYRMKCATKQNVPITNYGIAIAYMQGILQRSLAIFPDLHAEIMTKNK